MALFMGSHRYSHSRDSRRAFNIISLISGRSFISKESAYGRRTVVSLGFVETRLTLATYNIR